MRLSLFLTFVMFAGRTTLSETLRVPEEHKTIQSAIDSSKHGDTILVAAGTYRERIQLKPGIHIRSQGDESQGIQGLRRAEETILDGRNGNTNLPGVSMSENSVLDGFTITNIGDYDDAAWKNHFDTRGESLGDDVGALQSEGAVPAISVSSVNCTVTHCLVHHNGDLGIGIIGNPSEKMIASVSHNIVYRNMGGGIAIAEGATPTIQGNVCYENLRAGIGCRKAAPFITQNTCYQNIRAGIGCREGAQPVIQGNRCYQNRRAGIGIRMSDTNPLVVGNECYENEMAGIGCRDGASPIVRNNICDRNKMAGIGCENAAAPFLIGNVCRDNQLAGIGLEGVATASLIGNQCLENRLVAIGVTGRSTVTIAENELTRTGSAPPIIAVKDDSHATILNNRISGGGVAAVLVQGQAMVSHNTFVGREPKQGNAVWLWEKSTATISDNSFQGYRTAVNAKGSSVSIVGNSIDDFQGAALVLKHCQPAAHVLGNKTTSSDPQARVAEIEGESGIMEDNHLEIH